MNNTYTIFWPNSWTWEEINHWLKQHSIWLGNYVTYWDIHYQCEYTVVDLPEDNKQIVIDDEKMWSEK